MIGELDISGVFLPTLLVMMFGTYCCSLGCTRCWCACISTAWSGTGRCSTLLCMPYCLVRWTTFAET